MTAANLQSFVGVFPLHLDIKSTWLTLPKPTKSATRMSVPRREYPTLLLYATGPACVSAVGNLHIPPQHRQMLGLNSCNLLVFLSPTPEFAQDLKDLKSKLTRKARAARELKSDSTREKTTNCGKTCSVK
jgi:hypothetical protein